MTTSEYGIPDYMIGALMRYIKAGVPPGDFLTAVLMNDLREAVARATTENIRCLPVYVMYLYAQAPASCWGSPEKVEAWIEMHEQARQAERDKAEGIEP